MSKDIVIAAHTYF